MAAEVIPFRIDIPDADLADLRDRLRRTRWPEAETVGDWSQGVPLAYLRHLCEYWAGGYDWRPAEARLNALPQYRTEIDGLDIHFLHVRSPHPGALPLILTHGWPGSVIEFGKVIGPLSDPVAHGGDPADAFHVVCPSLPGYGFSGKPAAPGWGIERIAAAWATLQARLGYARYGAAGGDWGTSISTLLGQHDPRHVAGIHLMPPLAPPDPATFADLTDAERAALASLEYSAEWGSGYSAEHSTRPQMYWESIRQVGQWISGSVSETIDVPAGCTVFPRELQRPSRRWAARRFTDIRYWSEPAVGGHFAAFEQPEQFVREVRSFFRLVR